jgi:hypothetical protein
VDTILIAHLGTRLPGFEPKKDMRCISSRERWNLFVLLEISKSRYHECQQRQLLFYTRHGDSLMGSRIARWTSLLLVVFEGDSHLIHDLISTASPPLADTFSFCSRLTSWHPKPLRGGRSRSHGNFPNIHHSKSSPGLEVLTPPFPAV